MRARRTSLPRVVPVLVALAFVAALAPAEASGGVGSTGSGASAIARPPRPVYVPPIKHVFVINIENKGYDETFGPGTEAPYLAGALRRKGVLLNSYYATAHNSLPNYIAQISGQAPNIQTQTDCQTYSAFVKTGPPQTPGQAVGYGCVYPTGVRSLPRQLSHAGITWRGYMQQMRRPCVHPAIGRADPTQHAREGRNYAVRHNPFMYFRSIISHPNYCRRHVRPLPDLRRDLRHARNTPRLAYITPDLCRDGHDDPCANGQPGGLRQVDKFLKTWAPRILSSPAFKRNGMLIITADESDSPAADSDACCGETAGPNPLLGSGPGIIGPGGGKVGALIISHFTTPNTWSTTPYNHYSLLASLAELYRLPKLGMARVDGLPVFGLDVYNDNWWTS
ncbi:MAG TPA: alkaline phosphatase family protein [Nocardioides sp.]|nr:alkaline phosphatase family protein [Nocardioides sp.]